MFVFSSFYQAQLPAGHRFPMGKYEATRAALMAAWADAPLVLPEAATRDALLLVHGADYVDAVLEARVAPAVARRVGFPVTAEVARRAAFSVGGTLLAARMALDTGFAANLAGGSHHAMPDWGAGYCVFNDLAVAAAAMVGEGHRVLILDLDVHQGDGTAVCLAEVPGAFTFSMHAEKNFPARKARSDRDVGLADGTGDAAYLEALAAELPGLFDTARPDLVLVQAGVDVHAEDRLGRLSLSDEGIRERSRLVREVCLARGVPMAATMGGGYDDDPARLGQRHAMALMHLASDRFPVGTAAGWA